MGIDGAELRAGLAKTAPFLLSHHLPAERHRCYAPVIFGKRRHICARCLGIYPGIAIGVLAHVLFAPVAYDFLLVLVLPLPALVDWTVTTFTARAGSNSVRTTTGLALGFAYGQGLSLLFLAGDIRILAVGATYALAAGVLLVVDRRGVG